LGKHPPDMITSFDDDMDSLLNLDEFTPSTTSPSTQVPQLAHQSSHFGSSTQTFAGPSFPYDAYRQQTGLPAGGLANTFAVNQTAGLQYWNGQGSFVMPSNPIDLPALSKIEDFDFSRMDDLDFDAESPTILSGNPGQFVSPTTLVSSGSSQNQRIYPGMHSQAAQAKAEQAKQQQEMVRRQQQQQQQAPRALPAGQKPLPKAPAGKDPRVEESISRILNQMRQKSVSSDAKTEDSPDPNMSSLPKSRKDEEDMDEDERLLASEEGKKLTSKERRQLRNKVSARAFRSRRKGMLRPDLVNDHHTNVDQNISANLKAKLHRRWMKRAPFAPRTSSYVKRTTVSLSSLACFCPPKPSPVSCRS
jgi:bZIP-type transcription factor MBZ1